MLEKYLRKLYGGDFDASTDIEPAAWREVLRILNDAVATGLAQSDAAPTLEQDFYDQLRHANEVFSAFKVHSMGKRMAALLTDDSGQLKPFRQWRDEVMPIASHYVGPWLRTEYNTAVNRAHDAADWKQFERNSDIMPNLRWMPTTSAEPDREHRIFWKMKLTRPIDDPFWNKHRPGDHWNCKCKLEQTDDPATDIPAGADDEAPQPGLKGNPAKTGQIFDRSHPYFPKSCKGCTFAKGFKNKLRGFFNAEGDCYKCVDAVIPSARKKIEQYDEKVWERTYISENNGFLVTSRQRIIEGQKNKQEKGVFVKEQRMCKVLADNGYFVEHLDEVNRPKGDKYDTHINGLKADLKCITGGAGNIVKYTKHALYEQGAEAVVFEIPKHDKKYYKALSEVKRKCNGRIFFYINGENKLKELK